MAIAYVVCLVAYWLILRRRPQRRQVTYSISSLSLERRSVHDELMREIIGNKKCRDIIRMGPGAFLDLCDMLRKEGGLQPTQLAAIEEQVAKFLYILSHGVKHQEIYIFFLPTILCLFLVFLFETSLLAITDMVIAHCNSPFFSGLKTLLTVIFMLFTS